MSSSSTRGRVWLVERQGYLEALAGNLLQRAGFEIESFQDYPALLSQQLGEATPDLVVLGCARAGEHERQLLAHLVGQGFAVVLLVGSLSVDELRALFRAGAQDVDRFPDEPDQLLEDIQKNMNAIHQEKAHPKLWTKAAM